LFDYDLSKLEREDLEFVAEMLFVFNHGNETGFEYNGIDFGIDYADYKTGKIWVYEDKEGGRNFYFDTPEDFFEVFLLDGQAFLERLNELS
jgi:hypothetical protein